MVPPAESTTSDRGESPRGAVDRFSEMIGPANLLGLVRNTADFLFRFDNLPTLDPTLPLIQCGDHPMAFVPILARGEHLQLSSPPTGSDLQSYFALCLAAHHATVATFVPTDVDSKIRGQLWSWRQPIEIYRAMFEYSFQALAWDISRISTRATELAGVGPVSGHNGEMLGVLAGALGCFLRHGDSEYAEKATELFDQELRREILELQVALKQKGEEVELLKVAMSVMHNLGDLDQGINYWGEHESYPEARERFAKLGKERQDRYGGIFRIAGGLYRTLLASEGHRHYPLRQVAALRRTNEHLLPLGPWFDSWGEKVGRSKELSLREKGEVLTALLQGCKKIPGQQGYFRAIAGLLEGLTGKTEDLLKTMPTSARHLLKESSIRQLITVRKESFESSYRKRARGIIEGKITPVPPAA